MTQKPPGARHLDTDKTIGAGDPGDTRDDPATRVRNRGVTWKPDCRVEEGQVPLSAAGTPPSDLVFLKDGRIMPVRRSPDQRVKSTGRPRGYKRVRFPLSWEGVAQVQATINAAQQRGDAEFVALVAPQVKQMELRLQLAEARASPAEGAYAT